MTRTRKIAVVILTFGLLLVFVGYGIYDVAHDRRAKLRDEVLSAPEWKRPLVIAYINLELINIETDEQRAGRIAAVGFLVGLVGGVTLIIGGPKRQDAVDG